MAATHLERGLGQFDQRPLSLRLREQSADEFERAGLHFLVRQDLANDLLRRVLQVLTLERTHGNVRSHLRGVLHNGLAEQEKPAHDEGNSTSQRGDEAPEHASVADTCGNREC